MRVASVLLVSLFAGCGDDAVGVGDAGSSSGSVASSTSGSSTDPDASSTTLPSTSSADATSDGTSTGIGGSTGDAETSTSGGPAEPFCGDGVVDPFEECDDGNHDDADGCRSDCIPTDAVVWTTTIAGPDGLDGCLRAVAVGADETTWVTGWTRTVTAERDVWTGRLDADGALLVSHQYDHGGDEHDAGEEIVVDGSGDAFVAARVEGSSGDVDVRLLRIDATGEEVWGTSMSDVDDSYDVPTGLVLTGAGELVVAARVLADTERAPTFGRFAVDGSEVGVTTWSEPAYPAAAFVGLVRVADELRAAVLYDPGGGFSADLRLALPSFSLAGAHQSTTDVAPPIDASASEDRLHLAAGPEGGFAVATYDTFSEGIPVVRIFDGQGSLTHAWLLDAPGPEARVHGTVVDADGNVILVGRYNQMLWARKHQPDGTLVWDRTLPTATNGSDVEAVTMAPNGDVVLAGCLDDDFWVGRFTP